MRGKAKLLPAFLTVLLVLLAFFPSALAEGEREIKAEAHEKTTGTTIIMLTVPAPEGTPCTVSFDANGGTGTMEAVTVPSGEAYTLPENGFTAPEGKEFDGWDKGQPGEQITIVLDTVITAQWKNAEKPAAKTCTISFDANGGTGTMEAVTVKAGEKYTLPAIGFTAPEGKTFAGWDKGQPGTQITVDADTVITAQWQDADSPAAETCTVSFYANGGTGEMDPVTVEKGSEYVLPANGFKAPGGKEFDRWDLGFAGTKIKVNSDLTVTAQWKDKQSEPVDPGYDFKFTFTKTWQGDHEDSIDWVLYNPDGTVAHKKFNKKIVSENEWHYEAWFPSGADYYIIETVPEGYKVRYENTGSHAGETDRCYNGGTIINYKVPRTGDRTDLWLWAGLTLLGVSAVCGTLLFSRRKKENR